MTTPLDICSAALLMVGAEDISSFEDGSREAKLCASFYPTTRDELLQAYPWRFATLQADLSRLAETPRFGFRYAYQLPVSTLRVVRAASRGAYQVYDGKLYSHDSALQAVMVYRPQENRLPAFFVRALEYKLAEILSLALLDDLTKSQMFAKKAYDQLASARAVEAQQSTSVVMGEGNFALTQSRQ